MGLVERRKESRAVGCGILGPRMRGDLARWPALGLGAGRDLDLETEKWTKIDLGGADYKIGESTFGRIGDMRFSPDGNRLALLVTEYEENEPGLIKGETTQISRVS